MKENKNTEKQGLFVTIHLSTFAKVALFFPKLNLI
jgi:hypothetical protein